MVAIKNTWYELRRKGHYYELYEHFRSEQESYTNRLARIGLGKGHILEEILKKFGVEFKGKAEIYDVVLAMRLYLAMRVLSTLKRPELKHAVLDAVSSLPDEEALFWAWKVSSSRRGITAFKVLYEIQ